MENGLNFLDTSDSLKAIITNFLNDKSVIDLLNRYEVSPDMISHLTIIEKAKSNPYAETDLKRGIIYFNPRFVNNATASLIEEVFFHELVHYIRHITGNSEIKEDGNQFSKEELEVLKEDVKRLRNNGYDEEAIIKYLKERYDFNIPDEVIQQIVSSPIESSETTVGKPPHIYPSRIEDFTVISMPLGFFAYYQKEGVYDEAIRYFEKFVNRLSDAFTIIEDSCLPNERNLIKEWIDELRSFKIDPNNYINQVNDLLENLLKFLNAFKSLDSRLGYLSYQIKNLDSSIERLMENIHD
jgi:tetratricopeptide (TPR) repeat protein